MSGVTGHTANGLRAARKIVEALDPYVGAGATGAGLSQSDEVSAPVYAYRDTLLDKIDEAIERAEAVTDEHETPGKQA